MKIFDCHYHLNYKDQMNLFGGYDKDDEVYLNVIFNDIQEYKQYNQLISQNKKYTTSLIFDYKDNFDYLCKEAISKNIHALKIHSRIQKIKQNEYDELIVYLQKINIKFPIIVDAFYFGDDLDFQPSLSGIIKLAKAFPNNKIIIAHSGGYEILKYFFHLRSLDNIFWDLSFSLIYLADSSCYLDLKKMIKFTDKKKIMFGSDYPFCEPKAALDIMRNIMIDLNLSQSVQEQLLLENAMNIYFN